MRRRVPTGTPIIICFVAFAPPARRSRPEAQFAGAFRKYIVRDWSWRVQTKNGYGKGFSHSARGPLHNNCSPSTYYVSRTLYRNRCESMKTFTAVYYSGVIRNAADGAALDVGGTHPTRLRLDRLSGSQIRCRVRVHHAAAVWRAVYAPARCSNRSLHGNATVCGHHMP